MGAIDGDVVAFVEEFEYSSCSCWSCWCNRKSTLLGTGASTGHKSPSSEVPASRVLIPGLVPVAGGVGVPRQVNGSGWVGRKHRAQPVSRVGGSSYGLTFFPSDLRVVYFVRCRLFSKSQHAVGSSTG